MIHSQLEMNDSGPRQPPAYLYKYRSLGRPGSDERRYLERVFTHHEVYFASPRDFNDPFDCRVDECFDGTDEEWLGFYRDWVKRHDSVLAPEQQEAQAQRLLAEGRHRNPVHQRAMMVDLQCFTDNFGIFCVSTRPDSLAMWARYADGHRGICLEFEHLVGLFPTLAADTAAQQVHYALEMPRLRVLDQDRLHRLEARVLTKSREWHDEHEHRFLHGRNEPGVRIFRPEGLTRVIFGCRTPVEDRLVVRDWVSSGRTRPRLYEAEIREGQYALEIRRWNAEESPEGR